LAMTVIYPSPLLVLCDSPKNYRGQPGLEFLRGIPTVWDDSVVIEGEVGKSIVIARRAGEKWYLAAMNGDAATQLQVPLNFLGKGKWTIQNYADNPDGSDYQAIVETKNDVDSKATVTLSLHSAGGYAGIMSKRK
jgi:alpha-glucosidase